MQGSLISGGSFILNTPVSPMASSHPQLCVVHPFPASVHSTPTITLPPFTSTTLKPLSHYYVPSLTMSLTAGDMKNEENLLAWLLTEKDPSADFIEDMDGETLQRVIRDADAIAVYFCKYPLVS